MRSIDSTVPVPATGVGHRASCLCSLGADFLPQGDRCAVGACLGTRHLLTCVLNLLALRSKGG